MPKPIPFPVRAPVSPVPQAGAVRVPEPADAARVLEVAAERLRQGHAGAMATVLARHGSAPSTPGQKLLLCADGTCVGTVGGGAVEREVLAALEALLAQPDPEHSMRQFRLGPELAMCCGGSVEVLLEPLLARIPCLIVGAGHVAVATVPLLARLGFAITVCDDRDDFAQASRFPPSASVVLGTWDEAGRALPRDRSVALVMTHDHSIDQQAIEWALREKFAFVGGVGSRAKGIRTRDRLLAKGFSEQECARIRMPIGVDIGARLPDEIAVSIAAELVAWMRKQ